MPSRECWRQVEGSKYGVGNVNDQSQRFADIVGGPTSDNNRFASKPRVFDEPQFVTRCESNV